SAAATLWTLRPWGWSAARDEDAHEQAGDRSDADGAPRMLVHVGIRGLGRVAEPVEHLVVEPLDLRLRGPQGFLHARTRGGRPLTRRADRGGEQLFGVGYDGLQIGQQLLACGSDVLVHDGPPSLWDRPRL